MSSQSYATHGYTTLVVSTHARDDVRLVGQMLLSVLVLGAGLALLKRHDDDSALGVVLELVAIVFFVATLYAASRTLGREVRVTRLGIRIGGAAPYVVPIETIQDVTRDTRRTKRGEEVLLVIVRLSVTRTIDFVVSDLHAGDELAQAIAIARKAAETSTPKRDAYTRGEAAREVRLLTRGDETVSAWSARLRGMAAGVGSHREAPPRVPQLVAIAESAAAPPTLRFAALVALGSRLDPARRDLVLATAPATVREAVAALDDAAALQELLERAEREESEREESERRRGR